MDEYKRTPAATLPDGWIWIDYGDGSGSLNTPDGECYYSYDCIAYMHTGDIRYQKTGKIERDLFSGILTEFKVWAESEIQKEMRRYEQ